MNGCGFYGCAARAYGHGRECISENDYIFLKENIPPLFPVLFCIRREAHCLKTFRLFGFLLSVTLQKGAVTANLILSVTLQKMRGWGPRPKVLYPRRGTRLSDIMALVQQFDQDFNLALGALAANDATLINGRIDGAREQGFRLVTTDLQIQLTGKTTAEGPIVYGVCCNMNAAEVEAAIEADPQISTADDARGKGTYIKILGMLGLLQTAFPQSGDNTERRHHISYGKNGWSIPEGQAWSVWAYNQGSGALTSGTTMLMAAEHFGVWLRD